MSPKRRRVVSDDEGCSVVIHDLDEDFYHDHDHDDDNPYYSHQDISDDTSCRPVSTSFCDIPDGPLLLILSYCTSRKLESIRNGSNNGGSSSSSSSNWDQVRLALGTLSFTSKAMRERMLCLVRNNIPVDIEQSLLEPLSTSTSTSTSSSTQDVVNTSSFCHDRIQTICKHGMKLKSLHLMFDDQVYKSIFIHILNSCNLSCLQTLSLHVHPTNCNLDLLDICDWMNVPFDRTHRAILLSNWAFQEHVAHVLDQKACHVRKLHLRFKIEETLCGDLFHAGCLSRSLEELSLEGWCSLPNPDSYLVARSLSCLVGGKEFENLSKLKHVDLFWPRLRRDVLSELKSMSLESLCLKGGLTIDKVDCPRLKKMTLILTTSMMMDLRILNQCRDTLLDLTLIISNDCAIEYLFVEYLPDVIENLPVLKRLSLVTNASSHELHIRSSCLEEIHLYDAPNLYFKTCVCPKLQKIICRYQGLERDNHVGGPTDSPPRVPFEVPLVSLDTADHSELTSLENTSSSFGTFSFSIGNSQFVGTEVPKSCVVELLAATG